MNARVNPQDLFKFYPRKPTPEQLANAEELAPRINRVLDRFEAAGNKPLIVSPVTGTLTAVQTGGCRVPVQGKGTAHQWAGADDLHDPHARLDSWLVANPEVLEEEDLYMEDPKATAGQVTKGGWCHLAIFKGWKATGGNRIFIP